MKRILYFSQVSWSWIKQRPQFLAEELAEYYEVTVVTKKSFNEKKRDIENAPVLFATLYRLPFERYRIVSYISNIICMIQVWLMAKKYDIIWTSSPSQYELIRLVSNKVIVYDCMDDMVAFSDNPKKNRLIEKNERRLYEKANLVLCSANYLKEKLFSRYGKKDVTIVNNAIKSELTQQIQSLPENIQKYFPKDKFVISYIGTISEWMNYDLLRTIIDSNPNIVINLFGPCVYKEDVPERINFCGSVAHDLIFSIMAESSALIMPFVVTELIKSVNPVKLYEYIYSGKPCFAPLYEESKPFEDYTYLYGDESDCVKVINCVAAGSIGAKKSLDECHKFAENNTWKQRAFDVKERIDQFFKL